jgi:hypothetical protein
MPDNLKNVVEPACKSLLPFSPFKTRPPVITIPLQSSSSPSQQDASSTDAGMTGKTMPTV